MVGMTQQEERDLRRRRAYYANLPEGVLAPDIAKSAASGARSGVESVFGTGGDLAALQQGAVGWLANQLGVDPEAASTAAKYTSPLSLLPSTEDVGAATDWMFGRDGVTRHKPETEFGETVSSGAEFLTSMLDPVPGPSLGGALAMAGAPAKKIDPDWFPSITSPPGKDPDWFHPTGEVKLKDPFSSLTSETVPTGPMLPDKPISPEEMAKQGGFLMALYGDRTKAGQTLLGVNGQPLTTPVKLGGGGRYMQENPGKIWASENSRITTMAKRMRELEERSGGKPVLATHAAMGPKSGDYAKMTTRPLLDLAQTAKMSKKTVKAVDEAVREAGVRDWPGILKADEDWLTNAGDDRSKLAKAIQQGAIQSLPGVPSIAAIRKAITEDELMNAPLLTSGMSVGRFSPGGQVDYNPANPHDTYSTDILGEHIGNLGQLPFEVVFPDFMKTRPAAEQPRPGRQLLPTTGYTVDRQGAAQEMNDEWLDQIMRWLEQNR